MVDEHQTDSVVVNEDTPVNQLVELRKEQEIANTLRPDYQKRPSMGGIAMPFTLNKEADTASMMTLNSGTSRIPESRPMSPEGARESMQGARDDTSIAAAYVQHGDDGSAMENKAQVHDGEVKPAVAA